MSDIQGFIRQIAIDASSSGDNTLVDISSVLSSTSSDLPAYVLEQKRIFVLNYTIVGGGSVNAKFISGSTDITGAMTLGSGTSVSNSGDEYSPILICAKNEDLILNLSGDVQVSGHLTFMIK